MVTEYHSEREVLTELLELYKDNPCLWDVNNDLYGKKVAKEQAFVAMLDKYKLLVEDATIAKLKKKIETMRASYRREHKKVLRNRNHTPNLWYYNLMTFLNEGTNNSPTYQSEDEENTEVAEAYHKPPKRIKPSSVFLVEHSDPEESTYTLKSDETPETEAFGRALGLQLNGISPIQKTIAEKLISDVVYHGRLDQLCTKTSIINLNDDYL